MQFKGSSILTARSNLPLRSYTKAATAENKNKEKAKHRRSRRVSRDEKKETTCEREHTTKKENEMEEEKRKRKKNKTTEKEKKKKTRTNCLSPPMTTAAQGSTTAHAAVIATSPAKAEFMASGRLYGCFVTRIAQNWHNVDAAGERVVATIWRENGVYHPPQHTGVTYARSPGTWLSAETASHSTTQHQQKPPPAKTTTHHSS